MPDQSPETGPFAPSSARRLGPYRLLQVLGEGGMGTVWQAEQVEPVRRAVAVKLVKAGRDSKDVLARFEAERQAVAMMDHPNIAKVLEVGATPEGQPYFVMELVKGVPITRYCDDAKLSLRDRLKLFIPVCQAVQHAHQKGIIHRDLKPSNVLVALYDGKPVAKVIDFGVAKALHQPLTEKTLVTELGMLIGTPEYMAPEQAEVNALDIDTRADVYSLGVILYELLTGGPPFDRRKLEAGAIFELLRMIREEEPPTPSKKLSGIVTLSDTAIKRASDAAALPKQVRGELDWIVMKCLEKDRGRRYETANGLAADVQRYLDDEPVAAGPPSRGYRLRKFVRRNRGLVTGAAVVFLALFAGGALATWGWWDTASSAEAARLSAQVAEEKTAVAVKEEQKAIEEKRRADIFAREQRDLVDVMRIQQAGHAIDANDYGRARELLDQVTPERLPDPGNRTAAWSLVRREAGGSETFQQGHDGAAHFVSWSPDGHTLASAIDDHTVRLWDALSGQSMKELKGHAEAVTCVAWSPDGRTAASASRDNTLRLWDTATGKTLRELKGHEYWVTYVSWSPDGRKLASASPDNTIRLWDAATGEVLKVLNCKKSGRSLCWSPDSHTLASADYDKTVRLWDTATGQCSSEMKGHGDWVSCVSWSPDGRAVASGSEDKTVRLWDVATAQCLRELQGHDKGVTHVSWCPDGRSLASASYDKTVRLWNTTTGQGFRELKGHAAIVLCVSWSPDGRTLASASFDKTVRLWNVATGQYPRELRGRANGMQCASWSPDGRTLASAGQDGTVSLWDAASGKCLNELKGHAAWVSCVSWSPDGRALATASHDRTVRLWNSTTGKSIRELKGHAELVSCVSWSPDGGTLASASGDKTVRLWDPTTGKSPMELKGHAELVNCVSWSPDGRTLASASYDDTVRTWDPFTGQNLKVLTSHESKMEMYVSWSPDGRTLASASTDGNARLWNAATGQKLKVLKGHTNEVYCISWSPDGRILASAGDDKTVRLWDAATGQSLRELKGHLDRVLHVAWSPDGRTLASAGRDGKTLLWLSWQDPSHPDEIARRKRMIDPDPAWHKDQAAEAEQAKNWFAAAFHLRRLLLSEPGNDAAKATLASIEAKTKDQPATP